MSPLRIQQIPSPWRERVRVRGATVSSPHAAFFAAAKAEVAS